MIYLLYGLILGSTIYIYFLINDPLRILRIVGVINLISAFLTFLIGYVLSFVIRSKINFMNTGKIVGIVFSKFLRNGLIFLTVGLVCYITNYIINYFYYKDKIMVNS